MVAKWVRKNWDVVTLIVVTVVISVFFGYLIFRPGPGPYGF